MARAPFSLYLHIPYCARKCPYCDFNSVAAAIVPEQRYIDALLSELTHCAHDTPWRGRAVRTVYFGGGTPSLFEPAQIARVLDGIRSGFGMEPACELTLEVNPGTIGAAALEQLYRAGVNRLSIGAQSLQPKLLAALERIHTVAETRAAVQAARSAGFRNISLDLMYGMAGQSLQELTADLSELIALAPTHISAYCLTLEEGTPFHERAASGRLTLPAEELLVAMMQHVGTQLAGAGYQRYEISNFARPGFESRHNQAYWIGDDYLGLGAGAHSYFAPQHQDASLMTSPQSGAPHFGTRYANVKNAEEYMQLAAQCGSAAAWSESLTESEAMCEFFFLGLRQAAGVCLDDFLKRFGASAFECFPGTIERLAASDLLRQDGDRVALSEQGLLLADTVMAEFVRE